MPLPGGWAAEGLLGWALCDAGAFYRVPGCCWAFCCPGDMEQPQPAGVYKGHRALRCPVPGVPLTQEEAAPGTSVPYSTMNMEKEMVNSSSKAASPMPSRPEDQAISGQWLAAGDSSGLPACSNVTTSCHDGSPGEACIGQERTPEEICDTYHLSDWDDCIQEELSHSDAGCHQEASDWEESMDQEFSEQEDSVDEVESTGNGHTPSLPSSWENDSHPEDLMQHSWEQTIGDKPVLHEEDEWDGVSVLELTEDQAERERRWAGLSAGGFPGAAPREAWVEPAPAEPSSPGPCCASPARVEAPVAIKRRPSRLRRALRALRRLCRCPCLAPHTEQ